MGAWVQKACEVTECGEASLVVGLIPVRTDVSYFHKFVAGKADVLFLRGRLKFGDARTAAPFGSVVAIWGEDVGVIDIMKEQVGGQFLPLHFSHAPLYAP